METSLHRQLKALYAGPDSEQEVRLGPFRIDAVVDGLLVEIQYGSLGAIREKVRTLLADHRVLIVKPLAARKVLVTRQSPAGKILTRRFSPKRETLLSLFEDFVHFRDVFPHPNLALEVLLTEQEEHRVPPKSRRRRWRKQHEVCERKLLEVVASARLRTADDLLALLPALPVGSFTTADLAKEAGIARWQAQKIAYCLRNVGAVTTVGKRGNAWLYEVATTAQAA